MDTIYNVLLLDPDGNTVIALREFSRLEFGRSQNTVGKITLEFTGDFPLNIFRDDIRIFVYRQVGTSGMYLAGKTHYFIETITRVYLTSNRFLYRLEGVDSIGLLERRIVAYRRDTQYADKTIENANDGPADDLMKEYVRENFGQSALDADRNLDSRYISVAGNRGLGRVTERQASFRNLLSTVRDLARGNAADGSDLVFDMIGGQDDQLIFDVFESHQGANRGVGSDEPLFFSPQSGNLVDPELAIDYAGSINHVYVGGFGDGAGRLLREVSNTRFLNASPWSRREAFSDQRDYDVNSVLDEEGRAVLSDRAPKIRITAKANDVETTTFGVHFFYGDKVTITLADYQVDAIVSAFRVSVQNGVETLDIRLAGETLL